MPFLSEVKHYQYSPVSQTLLASDQSSDCTKTDTVIQQNKITQLAFMREMSNLTGSILFVSINIGKFVLTCFVREASIAYIFVRT